LELGLNCYALLLPFDDKIKGVRAGWRYVPPTDELVDDFHLASRLSEDAFEHALCKLARPRECFQYDLGGGIPLELALVNAVLTAKQFNDGIALPGCAGVKNLADLAGGIGILTFP
jgi:hypothetical protein